MTSRMQCSVILTAAVAGLVLTAPAAAPAGKGTVSLRTATTSYGRVLVDGRRHALYAFTRDGRGPSRCYGACAKAWPPYIVPRRPAAGPGARATLIGAVRRSDGRLQATYRGRPLYFYVGDRRPAQVLCQDVFEFGGRWLVLRGSGKLVR